MKFLILLPCFAIAFISGIAQTAVFDKIPHIEQVGSSFDYIGTGDFNGDGLTDIAGATHELYLWLQGANGQLQPLQKSPILVPGHARCLTVADLYNDGSDDLIVGTGGHIKVFSLVNGSFQLTDSLSTAFSLTAGVTTADFDGDGFMDIAVSHHTTDILTVLYRNTEGGIKWIKYNYPFPTGYDGHVIAGKFGSLQQPALVVINESGPHPLTVLTFDTARAIKTKHELDVPTTSPGIYMAESAAIVKKGQGLSNELWLICGGNGPRAKVVIWRDLQIQHDSTFRVADCPEAIQSDDLDCDDNDEPVMIHGGWNTMTVVTDTPGMYSIKTPTHYEADGLAIGDVNNDGRIDVCIANGGSDYKQMLVYYNITSPCWPVDVQHSVISENECQIFPNPARGKVSIISNSCRRVQICDVFGRTVYDSPFDRTKSIDLSHLSLGSYIVILINEKNEKSVRRLILE